MPSSNYLIEQMMADPNARVMVNIITKQALPIKTPLLGYIDKDFTFNSMAEWTSPYESFGGVFKFLQSLRNLAQTIGTSMGLDINLPIAMSFAQTIKDYMGSNPPEFNLDLTFIATKSSGEGQGTQMYPVKAISNLLACTSPNSVDISGAPSGGEGLEFMGVPLGYRHKFTTPPDTGYVFLKIGTWLQIPYLLVKSVRALYSKQVGSQGFPIFTTASVNFEFFRTPSYQEISSWFTGKPPYTSKETSIQEKSAEVNAGDILRDGLRDGTIANYPKPTDAQLAGQEPLPSIFLGP